MIVTTDLLVQLRDIGVSKVGFSQDMDGESRIISAEFFPREPGEETPAIAPENELTEEERDALALEEFERAHYASS